MFALAITIVVLSLIALALGARGRRVGSEPHCRGCGFDLSGLASPESAHTEVCPECGRSLAGPTAVVSGERRRRAGLIALGVALMLAGAGFGLLAVRHVDVVPYLPSRVLAGYTRWTQSADVLDELKTRLDHDELDAPSAMAVIEAALDVQANVNRAWDVRWGAFVETASLKKLLDEREERRYLDQMFTVTDVRSRPSTLAGWSVPVMVDFSARRGGVRGVHVEPRLVVGVKGFEAEKSSAMGGGFGLGSTDTLTGPELVGVGTGGEPRPGDPAPPPGKHTLDIGVTWWTFWEGEEPASLELTEAKMPKAPSGRWTETRPLRVAGTVEEIVPSAAGLTPTVHASALGVTMRRTAGSAHTTRVTRDGRWERVTDENPADVAVCLTLDQQGAQTGTVGAFDVYVVAEDKTQWLARTVLEPGRAACVQGLVSVPPGASTVDVVLRASPEAMLTRPAGEGRSLETEELVLTDVPVIAGHPEHWFGLQPSVTTRPKGSLVPGTLAPGSMAPGGLAPEPRRRKL